MHTGAARLLSRSHISRLEAYARASGLPRFARTGCRGDTRPARGSKLTLLSQRFARTVDGYHPSIERDIIRQKGKVVDHRHIVQHWSTLYATSYTGRARRGLMVRLRAPLAMATKNINKTNTLLVGSLCTNCATIVYCYTTFIIRQTCIGAGRKPAEHAHGSLFNYPTKLQKRKQEISNCKLSPEFKLKIML